MTEDPAVLEFHYVCFKMEWATRSESDFQSFFEDIMQRAYETFVPVAPAGTLGDKKSDGYRTDDETIYQVYAPSSGLKTKETCDKIQADFDGAKALWKSMKRWVFVWSSPREGLPPDAAALLGKLDADHGGLAVRHWGRDRLWQEVRALSRTDRDELLRPFPFPNRSSDAAVTVDVASLLNSVSTMPKVVPPDGLALTAPQEKIDKNELGPSTEGMIRDAMTLVETVKHVALHHPDPGFADRVAAALRALYQTRRAEIDDPDVLFLQLLKDVAGTPKPPSDRFWAAAAIVTRSFELCEVFEP